MTKKIETMSTIFLSLIIMSIVFTPVPSVMAAPSILVVDDDGFAVAGDCGDSVTETPYTTIQSAVDAAKPGDTIVVCDGVYDEAVIIDGNKLTVMAGDGEDVIVNGNGAPAFSIYGQKVTLKGFVAQSNDGVNAPESSCIKSVGNNNQLLDNIANNCKHGIYVSGQNNLIRGNDASYNENNGITTFNYKNDNNNKFIGNTANNNGAYGFYITGNNNIIGTLEDKEGNEASYNGDNNDNIYVWGNGHSISGNLVKDGGDGIDVSGIHNEITGNEVSGAGDDGIDCDCENSSILSNKVSSCVGDGIDIDGSNNTIEGNESAGNLSNGLDLKGNNNLIQNNKKIENPKIVGNDNVSDL